ncbi:MAG: MFS transporter [Anaerolineae bacterium]
MKTVAGSNARARGTKRALTFSKAFYAFYYGGMAFLAPFLVLYFDDLGFSGRQIGLLRGIPPLITIASAPLWGALADASRRYRLLRVITIAGMWLTVLGLSMVSAYPAALALVILQALFGGPVIPLVDSAVISLLGANRDQYGRQRLLGAVGWGISGLVAGALIERYGLTWSFVGYLILIAGAGIAAGAIRGRSPTASEDAAKPAGRSSYLSDLRLLLRNRSWVIFLVTVLIGGLYQAVEMSYLMLYLADLGVPESLMGVALLIGTISEVPIWAFTSGWLRRWGARAVLSAAFLAGAAKGLVYLFAPPIWLALGIQLVHGFAFPAMWAAGVAYTGDVAPEGTQATAQGIFGGVLMGLCLALGAFVGGWLYERVGPFQTFGLAGLMPLIALAMLWLGVRQTRERRDLATGDAT